MKNKLFTLITLFAVCFSLFILPTGSTAYANSALKYWDGVTASGAVVTNENVPIVVEKENLTFDINEFPTSRYGEVMKDYRSKVTAEYTFYNPSEYDVRATLVFPYGNLPMYLNKADDAKYGIKINGEIIESQIRHTYNNSYDYDFDYKIAVTQISDTYKSDEFYSPTMPVYKYSYTVSDLSLGYCVLAFILNNDDGVKYYLPNGSTKTESDETYSYGVWVRPNETIKLYAIGKDLEIESHAFYENYAKDAVRCSGSLTLESKETITFEELVLSRNEDNTNVKDVDYYNATIDMLNNGYDLDTNLNDHLMGWYQYELNMAKKSRVVNTVTAPIYPSINEGYEPPKYEYNYLLSPARSWANFGELIINVNTTAYMLEDTLGGFEKVDTGYRFVCNGLPNEELNFTLCEDERPKKPINWAYALIIIIPVVALVLIIAVIVTIVIVVKKKRKNKKQNK